MGRPVLGVALATLAASVLAGCAGIPTSGQVIAHEDIDSAGRSAPYVGGEVQGPEPGQTPEEIVDGFLEAMNFYEANYETAREYLTNAGAREWDPDDFTTVYWAEPTTQRVAQNRVRIQLNVWATVDAQREFEKAESGTVQEHSLLLEEEDGEWRIATPPPGLIIRDADFNEEFAAHDLFFYEPGFQALVPDTVYLPVRGPVATLLAQKLLEGPSPRLESAVQTAFPGETRLAVDAVAVTNREADVKLTDDALQANGAQRQQMVVQLAWTLGQLPEVEQVNVHGGQVLLDEAATRQFPDSNPASTRALSLFAVTDTGVVQVDDNRVATPVVGPLSEHPGVEEVAVDPAMSRAVVVDEGRTTLKWSELAADARVEIIAQGQLLRSPSVDLTGLAWVIEGNEESSKLVVSSPVSEPAVVPIRGLDGRRLDAVAVAADGARIALVADGAVYEGVIVRDDYPYDARVENVRSIDHNDVTGSAIDVAWNQYDELAVLTAADEENGLAQRAWIFKLAGRMPGAPAGIVEGAETLTANWRVSRQLAAGAEDRIYVQEPKTLIWAPVVDVRRPAFPG
ncbi:MAG TPA: LpqB family beta-propeller domain-containing protein [Jiangellaceae bacterium]